MRINTTAADVCRLIRSVEPRDAAMTMVYLAIMRLQRAGTGLGGPAFEKCRQDMTAHVMRLVPEIAGVEFTGGAVELIFANDEAAVEFRLRHGEIV